MKRNFHSQRGVVIPISAVMALALVIIIVGLGFDMARTRRITLDLAHQTDIACRAASGKAYLQSEALSIFSRQISGNHGLIHSPKLQHAKVISAHILIPTMPETGCFGFEGLGSCASDSAMVSAPALASTLGSSCALNCDGTAGCEGDCMYSGSVSTAPDFVGAKPDGFWDQLNNAGNTISCQVRARVRTLFFLERTIEARSSWQIPVNYDYPANSGPQSDDPVNTYPGLTVAIAPHLTTDANRPSMRFPDSLDAGAKALYDPLYQFDAVQNPSALPSHGAKAFSFPAAESLITIPPGALRIGGNAAPLTTGTSTFLPLSSKRHLPTNPSEREEMLTACMNPAILVRNALISGILERASRHGQFRAGTELLLVGTQSRVQMDPSAPYTANLPDRFARPTIITPFGDDILEKKYQIPYVVYNSGDNGTVHPQFSPGQGGWLNPFDASDADKQRIQSLLAMQLRICYQMFIGTRDNTNAGIERFLPLGLEQNGAFEPGLSGEPYYFSGVLGAPLSSASYYTDQRCPYIEDSTPQNMTGSTLCSTPTNGSRGMTAIEVASSLGSIQKCPYNYQLDGAALPESASRCNKPPLLNADAPPDDPGTDLRPDLIGLFAYLSNQRNAEGYRSPGLFELGSPINSSRPFAINEAYRAQHNANTEILVVTHYPLTTIERSEISCYVKDSEDCGFHNAPLANRRIILVYIPFQYVRVNEMEAQLRNFQVALNVGTNSLNSVFILGPQARGSGGNDPSYVEYWPSLLLDTNYENVGTIAENIFEKILIRKSLKY